MTIYDSSSWGSARLFSLNTVFFGCFLSDRFYLMSKPFPPLMQMWYGGRYHHAYFHSEIANLFCFLFDLADFILLAIPCIFIILCFYTAPLSPPPPHFLSCFSLSLFSRAVSFNFMPPALAVGPPVSARLIHSFIWSGQSPGLTQCHKRVFSQPQRYASASMQNSWQQRLLTRAHKDMPTETGSHTSAQKHVSWSWFSVHAFGTTPWMPTYPS